MSSTANVVIDTSYYPPFTTGTDTRPYVYWNKGMSVDWMTKDEVRDTTHYWNEDQLTPMEGGEDMDLESLVSALSKGVAAGWVSDEEAKVEFRNALGTVRAADHKAEQTAKHIADLEAKLAELKGSAEAGE